MDQVLSVVELSVDDCVCLHRLFTRVISTSSQLFDSCSLEVEVPVDVTVHSCVPLWPTFRELTLFFELTLTQVIERWTDGKGPLAMQLTPAQLARLVVAVFEKTARRDTFITQLAAATAAAGQ